MPDETTKTDEAASHAQAEDKVVWILGSGFSRSLGGPLLDELFQRHRFERIRGHWWKSPTSDREAQRWNAQSDAWEKVVALYEAATSAGKPGETKGGAMSVPSTPFFRNAEEFIELLQLAKDDDDKAASATVTTMLLGAGLDPSAVKKHAHDALTYIVAVAHEFLVAKTPSSERWGPYRRWARSLKPRDRVATFNYDRVVEIAHHAEQCVRSNKPVVPLELGDPPPDWLCKLHGSVDWRVPSTDSGENTIRVRDPFESVLQASYEPLIGIPGPGKRLLCEGRLAIEWQQAECNLKDARTIVFVGYRFPETDNDAKRRLLGAITENAESHLTIRLVLGPKRTDDVERLEGMLRWSLSHRHDMSKGTAKQLALRDPRWPGKDTFRIVHEPMWAEDFLAVFDREALHWPPDDE